MAFDGVMGATASIEGISAFSGSLGLTLSDLLGATADITALVEDFIAPTEEELLGSVLTLPSALAAGVDTGFDFTINVINTAGAAGAGFIEQITAVTQAALANWGQFIVGAPGSRLDVQVTIAPLGPTTIASAGATTISVVDFDGTLVTAQLNTITELTTGVDPNGATPDIVVTVGTGFLFGPTAFLSTDPNRSPPPGSIDYVSVLTHELAHGLGFLDLRDGAFNPLNFTFGLAGGGTVVLPTQSTFDALVDFDPIPPGVFSIDPAGAPPPFDPATTLLGRPFFAGETVVSLYGERVPLEFLANSGGTDLSHFISNTTPLAAAGSLNFSLLTDLAPALMDGFINGGDVIDIGALELAVFRDLGINVVIPDELPLINNNDTLFGPNGAFPLPVFSIGDFRIEGDQIVFDVTSSQATAFLTRNAVGVSVGGDNGSFTDRVFALPVGGAVVGQGTVTTVSIDAASLITGAADSESATGITEGLLVSLFSPSNARLASGAREETNQVEARISFTTISARGLDAAGDIITAGEIAGLGAGRSAQDANFYAILGDGDSALESFETAYRLADTAASGRLTRLGRDVDPGAPVIITAQGADGPLNNIRFNAGAGFSVGSDADEDGQAALLNGGESLTFELTQGFGVSSFAFTAASAAAGPLQIAFDTDGDISGGAGLVIEAEGGARVEVDFSSDRILIDGVAVAGDFSEFFANAEAPAALTVGSPSRLGFSLADVEIERVGLSETSEALFIAQAAAFTEAQPLASVSAFGGGAAHSEFVLYADYHLL